MNLSHRASVHWLIQRATAIFLLITILFATSLNHALFCLNIILFWHLYLGLEEILSDYVHHEITRNLLLILLKIFILILAKYAFVFFIIHV